MTQRKILVTSALPYANGPIHLGHLVEYIQTDIWVRFQKLIGNTCYYVCADDTHGTAIMLRAEKEGITPEALIERVRQEHMRDFSDFAIEFDNYYSTHSPENREFSNLIYSRLRDGGYISSDVVKCLYDPVKNMFLHDRLIKGECPKCGTKDQYGDNCESCGFIYTPTDLKNPISVLSGVIPVEKESQHFFLNLGKFEEFLKTWINSGRLQTETKNKLVEWFASGLRPWDISRDAPYFGFEIPDKPNKYFYVWLDAPIGYMASFKNLCEKRGLNFDEFWSADSKTELYHFIGKDILYFHALFWSALLHGTGFRTPSNIFAHGFLTVNGKKMSKSRGTFITARTYLNHLNPEYLRYYFAAKLGSRVDDIDLNLEDFLRKVNADLVGKVVNIASRCAGFITNRFAGQLSDNLPAPELYQSFIDAGQSIAEQYASREYHRAIRDIMVLADKANQYIDEQKPWIIAKQEGSDVQLQQVCTQGLNLFRVIMGYLLPVLPNITKKVETFFNAPLTWQPLPLLSQNINPYLPLIQRVETQQISAIIDESKNQ